MSNIKKYPVPLTFLLSVFILLGCGLRSSESAFKKYLPTDNVNNVIQLSEPSYLEKLQDSPDDIYLQLSNHSKDLIRFPIDYGIRLYVFNEQSGDWDEIENNATYSFAIVNMDEESSRKQIEREGGVPLYPEGSSFGKPSYRPISVYPVLTDRQLPVRLRVLVVGTIFRDDRATEEKVAAYYDVVIKP